MTARDFLTQTMTLIGALASGDAMSASEAADNLVSFNLFLESWSTQGLLIPSTVRETFSLVANQAAYTMGVGGNFNTSRPMEIIAASIIQAGSNPELEIPIKILTIREWAETNAKNITSNFPLGIYIENTAPLLTINSYPIPSTANKMAIYSLKPLTALASLDATMSFPPGYLMAMKFNFAPQLAIEYGRKISDEMKEIARDAKADLMRQNTNPVLLKSDFTNSGKPFNIYKGQ